MALPCPGRVYRLGVTLHGPPVHPTTLGTPPGRALPALAGHRVQLLGTWSWALFRISSLLPGLWIQFDPDYLTFGPPFSRSPQIATTPPSLMLTGLYPIY